MSMNLMIFRSSGTSHVGDFHYPKILHCNDEDVGEQTAFFFCRGKRRDKKEDKEYARTTEASKIENEKVWNMHGKVSKDLEDSHPHLMKFNEAMSASSSAGGTVGGENEEKLLCMTCAVDRHTHRFSA